MEWFYLDDGSTVGPNSLDAMKHHIKNGRISGGTLLWNSSFGDSWKPARSLPDFAGLFASASPPPPPPRAAGTTPPPPTPSFDDGDAYEAPRPQTPVEPDPPAVPPVGAPGSGHSGFRRPLDEDTFSVASPTARDALTPAGRWSRFFARQIDLTLWGSVAIFAFALTLAFTSVPTFYRFLEVPEAALGIFAVLLGIVANGIIVGLFGNSLGKTIFGIKVYRVGLDARLPFFTAIKREFAVWVYGLGLGIPIVALVTMIMQFRKVGSTGGTGYDAGVYLVRQKSVGAGRITLGIIIAILLIAGVAAIGAIGDAPTRSSPVAWTNPDSGLRTTISSLWEPTSQTADDGAKSTLLQNQSTAEQILVGLETSSSLSLPQYAQALTSSLSSNVSISNWTSANDGNVMMATGMMKSQAVPIDIYVYKVGNNFWRVISFDLTGKATGHFIDDTAHTAIVRTFN